MQELVLDPPRARVVGPSGRNGPTQADAFTSGSLTDLLNGPLGDTRFSDGNTPGYRSGVTSRSTLGSDLYFNERNSGSGFHSQSEYPSQSPPLWSPFDQRRDVNTQADPYGGYDFVGPTPMRSQVSTPHNSLSLSGANTSCS